MGHILAPLPGLARISHQNRRMRTQAVVMQDLYDPFGVGLDFTSCSGGVAPGYPVLPFQGNKTQDSERGTGQRFRLKAERPKRYPPSKRTD